MRLLRIGRIPGDHVRVHERLPDPHQQVSQIRYRQRWHQPPGRYFPSQQCDGRGGRRVEIGSLVAGEHLHSADGRSVEVKSVRHFEQQAPVYDLTVDEVHDYFVGAGVAAVLVHNCAAPNVRASPAASDWATKGAHLHVGGKSEVRIFPNHEGGVGFEPIRLSTGTASARDVAAARDAIMNSSDLRADLIDKAQSAMEHMNTHNWGNSKNRAPEMRRLITALGRIK